MAARHPGILPARAMAPTACACRTLEDEPVRDEAGRAAGSIARILIDPDTGRVTHAVIGCGGVLGLGERLQAVPWAQLRHDPESGFVLPENILQGTGGALP